MPTFNFARPVQENYDLTQKHLFKKRAGNAKYYYQLQSDESLKNDLKEISKLYQSNIPFRIYGMHTNLYITKNGYDGWFIDITPKKSTIRFNPKTEEFVVSGNLQTSRLVNYSMELGYDFASLTGVPGMVGAGIVGNASFATGKEYSDYIKKIILFDFETGEEIEVVPDEDSFSTRNSFIKEANSKKTRYFVKEAVLKAEFIGKEKVREKYLDQINLRREDLKVGYKEGCAGSIWSNIDMREKIGKSFTRVVYDNPEFNVNYNGARYSSVGCRFFTTDENTEEQDVAKLMKYTIEKLGEIYGIKPVKEVLFLDYDGEIDVETYIKRYLND